jgi:hypothetical protein
MLRLIVAFLTLACLASASLINPAAANLTDFRVTTFASGLGFPTGFQTLSDGSIAVLTSPGFGYEQGELRRFTDVSGQGIGDGSGTVIYTSAQAGMMTQAVQVGNYYAVGNDGARIGPAADHSIALLSPGATPASTMTLVATMHFAYTQPWVHSSVGLATRPTPGSPGSYDLVFNVGSQEDNIATPGDQTVTLTGTGFSSFTPTVLNGGSLYMVTIDQTGVLPAVTNIQQVATGIRNVFGMGFHPVTGDFWFADNAMDVLPAGSPQPEPIFGEPPQADELNLIEAADFATGPAPNFGFPTCYIQYEIGGLSGDAVGSGCTQPVLAFQPKVDGDGTHKLQGPTEIAFAPANFPAPFNNGVFVGFTGGGSPNLEAGVAYYSFSTSSYYHFIQSGNPLVNNIIGLESTADSLFIADASGKVYQILAIPEPGSLGLVAAACAGMLLRARRSRRSECRIAQ